MRIFGIIPRPRHGDINPTERRCDVGLGLLGRHGEVCSFEGVLDGEGVDARVFVNAGVAFAAVYGACKVRREFADESMVRQAEVAELKHEADEVSEEGGGVMAAVDEDGAVDVGVGDD